MVGLHAYCRIKLWEPSRLSAGVPAQPHKTAVTHSTVCPTLSLSRAATMSSDGIVRVWNTTTGRVPNTFAVGHRTTTAVEFTAQAAGLLVASQIGEIMFYVVLVCVCFHLMYHRVPKF